MILPDKCPKCEADLRSEELKGVNAIAASDGRWTRAFLIVQHDKAFSFRCPDCEHEWPIPWAVNKVPRFRESD